MKRCLLFVLLLMSTSHVFAQDSATTETQPSPHDGAVAVTIWVNPTDAEQSLLITTEEEAGLVTYDLDGKERQVLAVDGEANQIDVRYDFSLNGEPTTLIAVGINDEPTILFYTIDAETGELSPIGTLETAAPHTGLCLYVSSVTGSYYVFNTGGDEGVLEQYELTDDGSGAISGELRRSFPVGGETESCTADDEMNNVYVAEGDTAIWRYSGEPEAGMQRSVVDYKGEHIATELEGLTLYEAADGQGYLIATDEKASRFLVYRRADQAFVGIFTLGAGEGVDEVTEPSTVAAVGVALGDTYPDGLFVTSDDVNTDPEENVNFKLVSWTTIAELIAAGTDADETTAPVTETVTEPKPAVVKAAVETEPVPSGVDAADDPAVWLHPTDADLSTIIATDKTEAGGLVVHNLDGSILQQVAIGEVNNVDLRYNFLLDGSPTTIVAATNRTNNSLILYRVNEETRELENAAARDIISDVTEVYGFCMHVSPTSGLYYAFINSADTGEVEQWELFDAGAGQVDAKKVREFSVGTQTEGCVADDELGFLYVGEEAAGLWKYGAEPDAGEERTTVDTTEADGHLIADVEGVSIYYASEGQGYIIVSSQGSSEYAVYERAGDNAYVGKFIVAEGETIDGISGTDGIDVTNAPLGDLFPNGVFVAQDDTNIKPDSNQNFKLVSWDLIAEGLGLMTDTDFDPRTIGSK